MAGVSLRGFYCSGLSWWALARRAAPICLPKRKPRFLNRRRPPNSAGPVFISASTPAAGSITSRFPSPSSCQEEATFKGRTASRRLDPSAASRPDSITSFRSSTFVAGIEIDNSASGIRGQTTVNGTLLTGAPATAIFGSKFKDFGTARLRLGYAWGRFLPYLTTGFTYGTIETSYSVATPGFFNTGSTTATRSGVFPHVGAVGIGAEYAIAPNFTVKVEYLYDFINARPVVFNPVPGSSIQFNTRTMYHIARVGLNYKFDWLSPLAAPIVVNY
jgi:opacity protein-like surface antigen